jgi:hypothetical protein
MLATGLDSSIARPVFAAVACGTSDHTRTRSLPAMTRITGPHASKAILWERLYAGPYVVTLTKI